MENRKRTALGIWNDEESHPEILFGLNLNYLSSTLSISHSRTHLVWLTICDRIKHQSEIQKFLIKETINSDTCVRSTMYYYYLM